MDFSASQVADLFFREVFWLHGLPKMMVSSRDNTFMSIFWQEIFSLVGTELNPNTSYHPQKYGKTDIVNKSVGGYLHNYVSGKKKVWVKWLYLGEYCYNTTQHMSIGMSPFKDLYSYDPLTFVEIVLEIVGPLWIKSGYRKVKTFSKRSKTICKKLKTNINYMPTDIDWNTLLR
jgi:hypothetical protein